MDDEENADEMKKKTCYKLCVRFAEKTSMQGVPYIHNAKLWYAKAAWVFLLLVAIGVMTAHLWYLCDQFFDWPKLTKITLGFDNLVFPAVTFCNINPIRMSKIHLAAADLQELVKTVNPNNLDLNLTNVRKRRFVEEFDNVAKEDYDYSDYYDTPDEYIGNEDAVRVLEDTFRHLYMDELRDTRLQMGHQIWNMLVKCTFNGRECTADNFTVFNTPSYGNCYTIQSDKFVAKSSGPKSGLQLILYMENEEYLAGITQGHGVRISINNKNEIPFPADDGISVSTHKEHDLAIKLVDITRLPQPHGNCEDGVSFRKRYKKEYTRRACSSFFRVDTMIKECNCYDEYEAELLIGVDIKSKVCETKEENKCFYKVFDKFEEKKLKPSCINPCREKQYVKTLSSIDWPTDAYAPILKKAVCEMTSKCDILNDYTTYGFASNLIKINIYFEDLNFEAIEETPEIENAQFLSDVGGAIGLWIGLSMLSMFELIQLLVEFFHFGCYKCNHANENNSESSNNKTSKTPESSYKQYNEEGFHRQTFSQDMNYKQRLNGNTNALWQNGLSTIEGNKDQSDYGEKYLPETHYSNLSDYQYIGNYYLYKGKQNL